jgi:chemotaxis signal transduction protein
VLTVLVGQRRYALEITRVEEITTLRPDPTDMIGFTTPRLVASHRHGTGRLPVLDLHAAERRPVDSSFSRRTAVLLNVEGERFAILVDDITGVTVLTEVPALIPESTDADPEGTPVRDEAGVLYTLLELEELREAARRQLTEGETGEDSLAPSPVENENQER